MKAIAMIAIVIIISSCPVRAQQTQLYDARPKITVNGEAVVYVKPDKIVVTFGIETWDADIMTAKQKNNDILKKAIGAIKELGIPEKEIQTDHLSISPRYKDDYRKEDFLGYFVRNAFVVTLAETAKVEELATRVLRQELTTFTESISKRRSSRSIVSRPVISRSRRQERRRRRWPLFWDNP